MCVCVLIIKELINDSLIGIEHGERVDEWEILRNLLELGMRDEAVSVVVVVLEHGVNHRVHMLLNGLWVERR